VALFPVILCGGAGARLWPASTPDRPKPFIALLDGRSPLQEAALRVAGLPGGRPPIVVVGQGCADLAREQLAQVGVDSFIIAEPVSRDSGPALTAAALWVAKTDPDGLILAVASDHHIPDAAAFRAAAREGAAAAERGRLVAFGVRPTFAATAYGYIRPGAALGPGVQGRRVEAFVEKPDAAGAEAHLAAGYLWNSGNLVFRADLLLREVGRYAPDLGEAVGRAVASGARSAGRLDLGVAFGEARAVSIDVAVMEKTDAAAVIEIDHRWSDLGSWRAVWAASERDAAGNVIQARAVVADSAGCLIRAGPRARIVAIGLRKIAVVVEGDRVLVCDLEASGEALKDAVAELGEG
jgi:mannose-1-phosphate guanylyltransferase / mannose-6-phosphate isomerase